jgi:hypothetical protein
MTTLTTYPSQGGDSGAQAEGSTTNTINNSFITILEGTPVAHGGCRFENITINGSATVSAATLSLYGQSTKEIGPQTLGVMGVKPDQGVFTTTVGNLLTWATTYPTTATGSGSVTVSASAYTSILASSILSIVQELLAQGGWTSGDAISFIITGATSGSPLEYCSYATGSPKYEQLSITYTSGGGYTVTFNNNGGTGSLTAETDSSPTALSLFSTGTMALAAFHFVGWNTVADGTGTAYADGATYAFSASATLYAQWAPDAGIIPVLM